MGVGRLAAARLASVRLADDQRQLVASAASAFRVGMPDLPPPK